MEFGDSAIFIGFIIAIIALVTAIIKFVTELMKLIDNWLHTKRSHHDGH